MLKNSKKNCMLVEYVMNLLHLNGVAGILTAIVLMSGPIFLSAGQVFAGHQMSWDGSFDGNYTVDGVTDPYPQRNGTYSYDTVFDGGQKTYVGTYNATWSINGGQENTLVYKNRGKWFGNNAGWQWDHEFFRFGEDSDFASVYVTWRRYACHGIYCVYIRIIPNARKLNDELEYGQTLTITLNDTGTGTTYSLSATFQRSPPNTVQKSGGFEVNPYGGSNGNIFLLPNNKITPNYQA